MSQVGGRDELITCHEIMQRWSETGGTAYKTLQIDATATTHLFYSDTKDRVRDGEKRQQTSVIQEHILQHTVDRSDRGDGFVGRAQLGVDSLVQTEPKDVVLPVRGFQYSQNFGDQSVRLLLKLDVQYGVVRHGSQHFFKEWNRQTFFLLEVVGAVSLCLGQSDGRNVRMLHISDLQIARSAGHPRQRCIVVHNHLVVSRKPYIELHHVCIGVHSIAKRSDGVLGKTFSTGTAMSNG